MFSSHASKVLFLALSVAFSFVLFVHQISREPLDGFVPNSTQGIRVCSLALMSVKVKDKGQRSSSLVTN